MKTSKFWNNACFFGAAVAALFVWLFLIWCVSGCHAIGWAAESKPVNHFDISVLETWCGEPSGTIRMVGAWFYDENTFEDETGNLWGWDGVEEQAFYLLWIDDLGTPQIEDDQIIKVFEERG